MTDEKIFLALMHSNILLLLTDTLIFAIKGNTFPFSREILLLVTAVYYIYNPIPGFIWAFYADHIIHGDSGIKKKLIPFSLPVVFNTILSVLSTHWNIYFYIDENNMYRRGKFFLVMPVFAFIYVFYVSREIIKHRKSIKKRNFRPMLLFVLPPFAAAIVQCFFYGISLIWVCCAISILIVFIDIQNDQLTVDYLTKLYNRRHLDNYLAWKVNNIGKNNVLAGIMLDVDEFKEINDLYGHTAGDDALENIGRILRDSVRRKDFVARYGGDEFVIIMEAQNRADISSVVDKINMNIKAYNDENPLCYDLSFSMGLGIYDRSKDQSAQEFLSRVDGLMYKNKKQRKAE